MISEYLEQFTMIEAFSIDTLSAGSPSVFHLAMSEGVASTSKGSMP
jgi:hypothetical protein